MNDKPWKNKKMDDSISGQSAALFFTEDDSLAGLVVSHGIKVRDFILLSFLSDQGPMDVVRLVRVVGIESEKVQHSLQRLSAAGLVLRDPKSQDPDLEGAVRLTGRGQEIVDKIGGQLP